MNKVKNWAPELQSLSGLAIIFVVLIHATAYYLFSVLHKTSFEEIDFATRLVDNLIHGAVPMFIFISGYKYALNNIEKSYKEYAISRTNKVIKPFLIISMIFFIKDIMLNLESLNIRNSVINFFRIFIGYNIAYQLWYVPMYLFIILTYPILHKLIKNEKVRIVFVVGIVIIQYSLSWYIELLASHPFDFVYYYLFFYMGLVFCKYDIKSKFEKWDIKIITIFVIVALIITLNPINELCGQLKRFVLWPMSVGAYYFLAIRIKDNRLLQYLGKYSFYIFLLHEPIFCTKISYIFKSMGIYNSVTISFIIGILTMGITILTYKIIEKTSIKKLLF